MPSPIRHPAARGSAAPVATKARGAAVVAATLAVAALLLAAGRPGVVTTKQQQTFEGDVTETDATVTVVRGGMRVALPRGEVESIEYATYAERFEKQLAALAENDVDGRIALAKQAMERREFDLAARAIDAALAIDPLDREARRTSATLGAQLQVEARQSARGGTSAASRPTTAAARGGADGRAGRRYKGLDETQMQLVRQGELRRDDRVRVRFSDNVRKRYVDSQPGLSYRQFSTLPDVDQALAILTRGPREMADDVDVQGDPSSIQFFTRRLHGPIVQGCATSYCHGSDHAGTFKLLTGVPDASTQITNFYLLNVWTKDQPPAEGSMFSGGTLEMISRGRAEESILFQYALPRALAKYKHPAVRGWDGLFRERRDRVAVDLIEWIDRSLVPVRPHYDFQFSAFAAPPATTEPATTEPAMAEPATDAPASQPEATRPADATTDAAPAKGPGQPGEAE